MKQYQVIPFFTGCMSGSLNEGKLTNALNQQAQQGWRLVRTIHETKQVYLFWKRETHFLVFEKDL
jgi:hypothetical protein